MDEEHNYENGPSIYDVVSDAKGYFSSEFRNHVRDQNQMLCEYWPTCKYGYTSWYFFSQPDHAHVHSRSLKNIYEPFRTSPWECMVQFWKAEELSGVDDSGETRFLFSTLHQPFLIIGEYSRNRVSKGICSYRIGMDDIVAGDGGGEGGLIARVHRMKRLEYTPDIGYYSLEEYPHRDFAISCGIKCSLAIPISDSSGLLIGVLEAVSDSDSISYNLEDIIQELQEGSYFGYCKYLCGPCDVEDESLHNAISEIKTVMKIIGRSCDLAFAQTWILCSCCNFLSTSKRLHDTLEAFYCDTIKASYFLQVESLYNYLKKNGEGVVGKAALSSRNLIFCGDVSQFSITDYPFAHVVRHYGLASCFAIGLKSILTQSKIYVLEFFLKPQNVNMGDLNATLVPIFEAMKQNFQTFKLASGEELGDNLSVRVIDGLNPGEDHTLAMDLIHNGEQVVDKSGEGLAIGVAIAASERQIKPTEGEVSFGANELPQTLNPNIELISQPLVQICKRKKDHLSGPTMQNESILTIKAKYQGNWYRFKLPASSNVDAFKQAVSKRIELDVEKILVKYQDEDDDWVVAALNEDLKDYISTSISQGKTTLIMSIERKHS